MSRSMRYIITDETARDEKATLIANSCSCTAGAHHSWSPSTAERLSRLSKIIRWGNEDTLRAY